MKRWQHWAIQWVARFAIIMVAWPVTHENNALYLILIPAMWVLEVSNYREGKNQARGLYDYTHKGRRQ